MFVTFDGVDGTGKSTQLELFCQWLRSLGRDVVTCRDPGGTALGERIRSILLDSRDTPIDRRSEMLLYQASRAQLVDETIRPALAAGKMVVCDRYLLATVVYQGHAGGLDVDDVWRVGQVATGGIAPDLTFLLDMPASQAAARIDREMDRMEKQGLEYLGRVRQGYLTEAKRDPTRIAVIDAARSIEAVQRDVRQAAEKMIRT
jgi:dTMP kinase